MYNFSLDIQRLFKNGLKESFVCVGRFSTVACSLYIWSDWGSNLQPWFDRYSGKQLDKLIPPNKLILSSRKPASISKKTRLTLYGLSSDENKWSSLFTIKKWREKWIQCSAINSPNKSFNIWISSSDIDCVR
jgi:hypothetical protein